LGSGGAEDAGRDELLDLSAHDGVGHGLLPRGDALGVVGGEVLDHLPHLTRGGEGEREVEW